MTARSHEIESREPKPIKNSTNSERVSIRHVVLVFVERS